MNCNQCNQLVLREEATNGLCPGCHGAREKLYDQIEANKIGAKDLARLLKHANFFNVLDSPDEVAVHNYWVSLLNEMIPDYDKFLKKLTRLISGD